MTRRTTPRIVLTSLLTLASLALAGADPAVAATAPTLHVPNHATLRIAGHGYGHGHGLSQYGAEGAARKGLSTQQILSFYYPHTRRATITDVVRVHLTADTDNNTTIVSAPGLQVHDLGSGATYPVPAAGAAAKATRWRLSAATGGGTKVSYRTATWHAWRTLSGDGEFRAHQPLKLVAGSKVVAYRGSLQLRTPPGTSGRHRITVNRVSLDAYVKGVVPNEMPALWHPAALRAQAIAARTYAAYEVAHSTNGVYQLCDSSACQVYGGLSSEYPSTNDAVEKTAGEVRTYHGSPAFTQFSASDGGWTSDGAKPYLVAQKDPYDGWSGNAVHTWAAKVSSGTIEKKWPALGNLTSITVDQRDGHGQWGGRVETLTLGGSRHDVTLTGDAFRLTLGLRSTWVDITT